jgi:hypothetical protein
MRRTLGIALLVLLGGCTCGKKEEKEEKKADEPAAAKAEGDKSSDPASARRRLEAMRTMRMAPVTLEEVQPLIPSLPDTTPVGQPGLMTQGRQVKAVLCMTSPGAEPAMGRLVEALKALGFTDVQTRPHPRNQEMVTLHAEKQPFQVGGTVQKTTTPDCPGDKGKIKIVLSYFKRVTIATPSP